MLRRVVWILTLSMGILLATCGINEPESGSVRVQEIDGMVQVYVHSGEFIMGNSSGPLNESPIHDVYLDGFWIDQTEISNQMFNTFVSETGYITDAEEEGRSMVTERGNWGMAVGAEWRHPTGIDSSINNFTDHPVVQISWADAYEYCAWAGRRLPTEAEWEKAARGTEGYRFPWGDEAIAGNYLNLADATHGGHYSDPSIDDGYAVSAPVGSFPEGASPYGALDMAGNVWEWVADFFDPSYYHTAPTDNPTGPEEGNIHVSRGGSWNERGNLVRTTSREGLNNPSYNDLGFRCASDN